MKAVAPVGTTMNDIYKAALPFIICDILALVILFYVPALVTWPVDAMY
jgi:TRAP-type mannitol/chloroaromatic compound transport system permease large subunit